MIMSDSEHEQLDEDFGSDDQEDDALDEPLPEADVELASHAGEGNGNGARERGDSRRRRQRRPPAPGTSGAEPAPEGADERARQALDFVGEVVEQMGMECRVRLRSTRDGDAIDEINIEITGRDAGRIIGKKGQVLQALQFLTHRVINRPGFDRRHILVDAEGYRSRRDDSLASMARRLGRQAVEEGKIITFEPMNPRDRRVVHLALAKFEGVVTKSDGEGADRRVQIIPVRRSP
jgi:spoIIIJ-associated protein